VRRLALALATLAGMGIAPASVGAVIPGANGPLVFTSGRDDGTTVLSNTTAQIWFLSGPGGSATRLSTLGLSHYRHATWSPDRTKVAYARGPDDPDFNGPWDIFVQDLANPGAVPVPITASALNEDRPTWSPDGTRLAYAKQVGATSWNIVSKASNGAGLETTIAVDASIGAGASGQFSRPQWTPDSSAIFYGRTVAVGTYDIYRTPADGSNLVGTAVVTGATNDYQPSLSADGSRLCFTRDTGADKDVMVLASTGAGTAVPLDAGGVDYECAWSPDGARIAFVRGAFGAGEILVKDSDATPGVDSVTNVAGRFDGNPEWTRNPSPVCSDRAVDVAFNGFASIALDCSDDPDPPAYADNPVGTRTIATGPANGVLGGISDDDTVIYTPDKDFQGTDTFTFTGSDETSDSPPATVTIDVAGPAPPPNGGPGADATASDITEVSVAPRRWRRGSGLPISSAAPVGTTIRWRLSEAARVTLSFQRARPGRRVGRRCVAPTPRRRSRPRCVRFSRAGRIVVPNAQAGVNTLRFEGRLTSRRQLGLGVHRVIVGAVDAAGNRSDSRRSRTFRIVAR